MDVAVCVVNYVAAYLQQRRRGVGNDKHHKDFDGQRKGFLYRQLGSTKSTTRTLYEAGWRIRQAEARANGECGRYVGAGRFAEKGGGQQVGNAFESTSHNERIKALYGNYNFWSWLRYWYLDSADFIAMMAIDKSYFDYDYEEKARKYAKSNKPKRTAQQQKAILQRFGFGNVKTAQEVIEQAQAQQQSQSERAADAMPNVADIQKRVMADLKTKKR